MTTKHPPVRVTSYVWRLQDGLPFTIRYFLTTTRDPCVQDTFFDNYKKSFRSGCVIFWQLQEILAFRIRFLTTTRSPSVQDALFFDNYKRSFRSGYVFWRLQEALQFRIRLLTIIISPSVQDTQHSFVMFRQTTTVHYENHSKQTHIHSVGNMQRFLNDKAHVTRTVNTGRSRAMRCSVFNA